MSAVSGLLFELSAATINHYWLLVMTPAPLPFTHISAGHM